MGVRFASPFSFLVRQLPAAALALALAARPAYAQNDASDSGQSMGSQLTLRGFSDVTLAVLRDRGPGLPDSTASGFALGQFDLFLTSPLGDKASFFAETVFELGSGGEQVVDIERLFIAFAWSDFLRLRIGRTHTALGYWNEAFHHGALLQPTVGRPVALEFEDDGGLLPVHAVGLEASGDWRAGSLDFKYVVNVANGRGSTPEEIQIGADANRDKAVAIKLTAAFDGPGRVEMGPVLYRDRIPADPSTAGRENPISEWIRGAHLYAEAGVVTVLAEYFRVRHRELVTRTIWNHDAWYATATTRTGRLRPYLGIDRVDLDSGDPFYATGAADRTRGLVGLRFEHNAFSAFKVEYRHDWRAGDGSGDAVLVQSAFTF